MTRLSKIIRHVATVLCCAGIILASFCVFTTGAYAEDSAITAEFKKQKDNNRSNTPECQNKATKCSPFCKYEPVESCTLCPIFAAVFNTVSTVGATAVKKYSNSVIKVVLVAFGIWLTLQVLAFVSSIETRDLKDLMQSILTQGFLIVLVVVILSSGASNFFNTFINPVYLTGQRMAQAMFSDSGDLNEIKPAKLIISVDQGIARSMGDSIIQTMTDMENKVRKFKALGSALMCESWNQAWWGFIPKFIYLFTGFLIWVFSLIIIFGVPFLMVDSVFQLGVAVALLPPAVGGFAFKSTRQYSKKVWETVLNSMFAFVFISVVVLILLGTLQSAVVAGGDKIGENSVPFDDLFKTASGTVFQTIIENFQWASPQFLRLAFIFILAWSVMNMAKEFADEFAGSISSTSIGSSIGTMAASKAKGLALKTTKPVASAAWKGVKQGARRIGTGLRHSARRNKRSSEIEGLGKSKMSSEEAAKKAKANGGTYRDGNRVTKVDANGNIKTVEVTRNGKKVTTVENGKTVVKEYDKKGRLRKTLSQKNGVVTEEKYSKNGARKVIERSEHFTITRKYDKNGVLISEETKANTNDADKLLNGQNGEFKKDILDGMTQGMDDEQKASVLQGVSTKINQQRIGAKPSGKIVKQEVVYCNYEEGKMEIKKTTDKGEVIFETIELTGGMAKTTTTMVDAKGRVKVMESDGLRNKLSQFELEKNTIISDLRSTEDTQSKIEKDKDDNPKKPKVSYGYTKYARKLDENGEDVPPGIIGIEKDHRGRDVESREFRDFMETPGKEMAKAEVALDFI